MNTTIQFCSLLQLAQEHISEKYSALLTVQDKVPQLKSYLEKYVRDNGYEIPDVSFDQTIELLYREMVGYSVLTPYLGSSDLEEINVNAWNDIALTYSDGSIRKLDEHFFSPQHAVDIVKRLLHHSGMIIDNATPIAQGHLPNNTRITALKDPIIDEQVGIAVSIRLLHPQKINRDNLCSTGLATQDMIDFLCMCIRYGVSFVVAGATSSGKTTLLNGLLESIPDQKRVFSIESGSRELSLVRETDGRVRNNVVHTLSRPSDNPAYDISQEQLVVASLRFNPDIIAIGEMRDTECYAAVESSLTGHTVVSTVHAAAGEAAHTRIALLCQKRFPIDFNTSLLQAAQAFPIVVYTHRLENNQRKIMDISECEILPNAQRRYKVLYNYTITKNIGFGEETEVEGYFEKRNDISPSLEQKLIQYGVPQELLHRFKG
ncbi:MAG: ATPase, T2SS/T4P/T4SS family [Saccharofermentanales bacterium]